MRSLLLVLAACGFEHGSLGVTAAADGGGSDSSGGPGDGGSGDGGSGDGGSGADAPQALGPFGAPTRIDLGGRAEDPALTDDLLELYFASARGGIGGVDIYSMTRATVGSAWSAPAVVPVINSTSNEYSPGLSPDGLAIWFTSDRAGGGGGGYDVWTATRPSRAAPFTAPTPVTELNSSDTDSGPGPLSLVHLVFHRMSAGAREIFETRRASPLVPWQTPASRAELNTGTDDRNPHLVGEREIYFASERAGGLGGHDLYVATRPSVDMPFSNITRIDPLSTLDDEGSPWVSPDRRHIVFSSTRSGNWEVYEATR